MFWVALAVTVLCAVSVLVAVFRVAVRDAFKLGPRR